MGHLLSSLFLSISSNIDNFAVGIAYGIKKLKIGILSNLIIAIFSGVGTLLSMSVGAVISKFLSVQITKGLGSGILIVIGIWGIWEALKTEKQEKRNRDRSFHEQISYNTFIKDPDRADVDHSHHIDPRESITLAFALTINNLGAGIGGGLAGLNIIITVSLTFTLSILAILVGYFLGERFRTKISGKWSEIVSGCLIITIGLYEYFAPSLL